MNKSEIIHFVAKALLLMWHLVHWNRVRNGHDRRPQTCRMRSSKLHFWKFLWIVCCTTQSTVESMMTRMMSTAFRCSRNGMLSRSPLCWFDEYAPVCVVVLQWAISNYCFLLDSLYEKKIGEDLVFNSALTKSLTITQIACLKPRQNQNYITVWYIGNSLWFPWF